MRQYIRYYIWEYIVCAVICAVLVINIAQGFYIPDSMADNVPMTFGLCAALVLCFYLISYNKTAAVIGLVASAAVVGLAFLIMAVRNVDIVDHEGSESAYIIYWFVFAIVCIAVFFVSRYRIGVILVFLAGILISAMQEYLEFESPVWTTIVFVIGCILLYMLRQHRATSLVSSTADPKFGRFTASIIILVLIAALAGGGLYYALIRPLNPPTATIKFFEEYKIYDILKALGITDDYRVIDKNKRTNQLNDEEEFTDNGEDQQELEEDEEDTQEAKEEEKQDQEQQNGRQRNIVSLSRLTMKLTKLQKVLLIILLILLALILPPLIKHLLRKRKISRLSAMEEKEQACAYYSFYLKKFARLGFAKNGWETPEEYEKRFSDQIGMYLEGTCGLSGLTETFTEARYAGIPPEKEKITALQEMYPKLIQNCKKLLGFRYIFKYFVL